MSRRTASRHYLVTLVLMVAASSAGCPANEPAASKPVDSAEKAEKRNADLLENAWSMLQPEALRVTSNRGAIVAVLNEWLTNTEELTKQRTQLSADAAELLKQLLPAPQFEAVTRQRFSPRDADHIGTCIVEQAMAAHAGGSAEDDVARIVALFDYVCRNIALVGTDEELPYTRFETMLVGRGSAQDRAYLFANLARQLQLDAVILQAGSEAAPDSGQTADAWLVGVLAQDEVYLFDTELGWPIPAPDDDGQSVTVSKPATLSQVLADDSLLRRLDSSAEQPYPLTADLLKNAQVQVIGNTSFWSPLVGRLQEYLSGDRSVVVSDPLQSAEGAPGLVERVAGYSPHWNRERITVWPFPETKDHAAAGEAGSEDLKGRLLRFNAPLARAVNEQSVVTFGGPEKSQLKTRIKQLLGNYPQAIQQFQAIRIDSDLPHYVKIPEAIRSMHAEAVDDASYWVGLCQYEIGEYRATIDNSRNYLARYNGKIEQGRWPQAANLLLALALAQDGRAVEATLQLSALDEGHPQIRGCRLLLRRWQRKLEQQDAAAKPTDTGE
jgi:hypothetical protein